MNFKKEVLLIKRKFVAVSYPIMFTEIVIRTFRQKDNNLDTEEQLP